MNIQRFEYLFDLYLNQKLNSSHEQELMKMLSDPDNNYFIKEYISRLYEKDLPLQVLTEDKLNLILNKVIQHKSKVRRLPFKNIVAIAASILLAVITSALFLLTYNNKGNTLSPESKISSVPEITPPTKVKAFITLANGTKILVDQINEQNSIDLGEVQIVKRSNDTIAYKGTSNIETLNTLENPNGSQPVSIILSDGSKVSLNSGSRLTYPVAFTGKERKVEILGEAYFEVAHNAEKPFIVNKGDVQIKVLGTSFNVKAYSENKDVEVTLLKGRVLLLNKRLKQSKILLPGQRAKVGNTLNVSDSDAESAIAWTSQTFVFNDEQIEEISRTLSRWYNVEVEMKDSTSTHEKFSGIINKQSSLNETIKMLQTGGVKIQLYNNKIIF